MENSEIDKRDTPEIDQSVSDEKISRSRRRGNARIFMPILFVLVGVGLLLRQLGIGIPDWILSWQMFLIVLGIFSGLAHAFRGPGWLILILVGSFFLMDSIIPGFDLHRFLWPAIIILVGLVMLIRPKKPFWMDDFSQQCRDRDMRRWERRRGRRGYPANHSDYSGPYNSGQRDFTAEQANAFGSSTSTSGMGYNSKSFSSEDFIDATTVLGGIHKNILSKNFKGGDITIFMGGAEINLTQADIQGTAALDITQIMGGTKIIVPPHWEVRSQMTSVFGNIEDKRQNVGEVHSDKVLIIDGTSIFGGIEIRNY